MVERMRRAASRRMRRWLQSPGLFGATMSCMAIGIGAMASVWAVFDAGLLRPLPFGEADRLASVAVQSAGADGRTQRYFVSLANLEIVRTSPVFEGVAAAQPTSFDVSETGAAVERIDGARVTADWFDLLRLSPLAGRLFGMRDEASRVVVVSEGYWRGALGGDVGAVGRTIALDGSRYEVVGVVRDGAAMPIGSRIWVPLDMSGVPESELHLGNKLLVGRLASGVTMAEADRRMAPVTEEMVRVYPDRNTGRSLEVRTLRDGLVGDSRGILLTLLVGASLLLLIACANLGNLALALFRRDAPRHALCAVLGAGRGRIVRGVAGEALALGVLGAMSGIAVSVVAVPALRAFAGLEGPLAIGSALDIRILGMVFAVTIVVSGLFAAVPAAGLKEHLVSTWLSELGRGRSGSRSRARFQRLLIATQTGLGVVLLMTAGLANQRMRGLLEIEPGFRTDDVLTVRVGATAERYAAIEARSLFFHRVLDAIRAIPGVTAAGASSVLPVGDPNVNWSISIEERRPDDADHVEIARGRLVTDGYFGAMGIPLLRGRDFTAADDGGGAPVVIVSRAMAEAYWPGEDAIGKRIKRRTWDSPFPWMTVVGVAGDVRDDGPAEAIGLTIYMPAAQIDTRYSETMSYAIRTQQAASGIVALIRSRIAEVDPAVAVFRIATMQDRLAETLEPARLARGVLGSLGIAGVLLLVAGLYGVVAQATGDRIVEIGVRIAFGARTTGVLSLILRQSLDVVAAGAALGLLTFVAAASALSGSVADGEPPDRMLWLAVPLLVLVVATAAAIVPAWRACRTDPAATIRGES